MVKFCRLAVKNNKILITFWELSMLLQSSSEPRIVLLSMSCFYRENGFLSGKGGRMCLAHPYAFSSALCIFSCDNGVRLISCTISRTRLLELLKKYIVVVNSWLHILCSLFQKTRPNIRPTAMVIKNLIALYHGFL